MTDAYSAPALRLTTEPPLIVGQTEAALDVFQSPALLAVIRERLDQVERHGFDAYHDDLHDEAEIAQGALAYLIAGLIEEGVDNPPALADAAKLWPWPNGEMFKPADYATCLIKAAAMAIAEADRVIRARALMDHVAFAFGSTGDRVREVAKKLDGGCRVCGCTDDRACVTDGVPCHWVEVDLCSACVDKPGAEQ